MEIVLKGRAREKQPVCPFLVLVGFMGWQVETCRLVARGGRLHACVLACAVRLPPVAGLDTSQSLVKRSPFVLEVVRLVNDHTRLTTPYPYESMSHRLGHATHK